MEVLIKTVRVAGFRGLKNIEINLEKITVLTGMNNAGKSSFLKALQIAMGYNRQLTNDDYNSSSIDKKIIIDVYIVPINSESIQIENFSNDWEAVYKVSKIKIDGGKSFVPIRCVISYDKIKADNVIKHYILPEWSKFKDDTDDSWWYQKSNGVEQTIYFDEMPFFYVEAQRDILNDLKIKSSPIGKMLSKVEYSKADIKTIEKQIEDLNKQTVDASPILKDLITILKELNSAMDTKENGVEISPFTKKIRDLNKGLSIYYGNKKDSFPMDFHGSGTRSWASLLTLKAYIESYHKNATEQEQVFFPIVAVEEPEAHLHPNAQKQLFEQIKSIKGQKIISTHSPYIVASADLVQLRNLYKTDDDVQCGFIDMDKLDPEDQRKIKREVIRTRGELFFSKVVILFEGETEEQALPMFTENYFKRRPAELSVDFIGVGGHCNYLPFIRVLDWLKIPWIIFSDAETETKQIVIRQLKDSMTKKIESDAIIFLDDGNDFESQLIADGFAEEIRKVILTIELSKCVTKEHKDAKEKEINRYDTTALNEYMDKMKTEFSPKVTCEIIQSGKEISPKIKDLIEKIKKHMEG